jgi:hypothetical protein
MIIHRENCTVPSTLSPEHPQRQEENSVATVEHVYAIADLCTTCFSHVNLAGLKILNLLRTWYKHSVKPYEDYLETVDVCYAYLPHHHAFSCA